MKKYTIEAKDTFKRDYIKKVPLKKMARETGISLGTLRIWRKRFFPKDKAEARKEPFITSFIDNAGNLNKVSRELNISRTTAIRYRMKYLPEFSNRDELFIKLMKATLSVNELCYLLRTKRIVINRMLKKFKEGKMRHFDH